MWLTRQMCSLRQKYNPTHSLALYLTKKWKSSYFGKRRNTFKFSNQWWSSVSMSRLESWADPLSPRHRGPRNGNSEYYCWNIGDIAWTVPFQYYKLLLGQDHCRKCDICHKSTTSSAFTFYILHHTTWLTPNDRWILILSLQSKKGVIHWLSEQYRSKRW